MLKWIPERQGLNEWTRASQPLSYIVFLPGFPVHNVQACSFITLLTISYPHAHITSSLRYVPNTRAALRYRMSLQSLHVLLHTQQSSTIITRSDYLVHTYLRNILAPCGGYKHLVMYLSYIFYTIGGCYL